MGTTTQILTPATVSNLFVTALDSLEKGRAKAYGRLWHEVLIPLLTQYWILILTVLVGVLIAAFLVKILTGRWAWLGSVLYNYLFWGTLFLIGLIWGPETYAKGFIDVLMVILYIVCFKTVGMLLRGR